MCGLIWPYSIIRPWTCLPFWRKFLYTSISDRLPRQPPCILFLISSESQQNFQGISTSATRNQHNRQLYYILSEGEKGIMRHQYNHQKILRPFTSVILFLFSVITLSSCGSQPQPEGLNPAVLIVDGVPPPSARSGKSTSAARSSGPTISTKAAPYISVTML